ncbi:MAG: hypothetical protein K0Q87_5156 [Neobacillus sp.]|nr:hypothetical protein [Neobacillus sp.]
MHFQKKLIVIGISLAVMSAAMGAPANASTRENILSYSAIANVPEKSINTLDKFKSVVDKITNSNAYKNLNSNEKEVVIKDVQNHLTNNVSKQVIDQLSKENAFNKLTKGASDDGNVVKTFTTDDGLSLTLTTNDSDENSDTSNNSGAISLATVQYNVTKKYGDRKYVLHWGLNYGGFGLINFELNMHYTLGSDGIKMRYSDTSGTGVTAIGTVSSFAKTTDTVATHEGANVNAYGHYDYTLNSGVYVSGGTTVLHGYVKMKKWNKSSKSMELEEGYNLE